MTRLTPATGASLLPAGIAVAVFLWWAASEGGYEVETWVPGGLLLGGLLVAMLWALRRRRPSLRRSELLALGAFGAYVAWSYLSVLWADAPGVALEGSHRSLVFLAVVALMLVLPVTSTTLRLALIGFCLGVATLDAVTLARAAGSDSPGLLFLDARLSEPLGYQNATAALWTMAALPALVLAARPETSWPLRPLLLAAAALLMQTALLSQSRGWLFALPVIGLVAIALAPGRLRLALWALPVVVAVGVSADDLLEPFRSGGGQTPPEAAAAVAATIDEAVRAALTGTAAVLVVGVLLVGLDRWSTPSRAATRVANRLALAIVAAALAAGAVVGWQAVEGQPVDRLQQAWTDFRDYEDGDTAGENRFTSLGSVRYDFWRVSVAEWRAAPLLGIGQDNFAEAYLLRRRDRVEEPRWTHSLPLRLLVHTGVVGGLLFAAALVALLVAALGGRRRLSPEAAALSAAALLPLVVWMVHGAVDWLWEFPALTGPALGFAALAAAYRRPGPVPPSADRPSGRLVPALVTAAAVLAAVALVPLWIAERDTAAAIAHWRVSPAAALERLDRAADLRPLAARPPLVEGIVAAHLGRPGRAREAFLEAARRAKRDWFARFQLGLLASQAGDRTAARRRYREALERNPLDPLVREAMRRLDTRRPVTLREADAALLERSRRRFGSRSTS